MALIAQPLAAQRDPGWTAAVTQTGDPSTIAEWTPLAPIANHHPSLPAAPLPPQLILLARPLTGAFWTAGNPAALPAEVHETHGELRAGVGGVDGAYRRPLDAPRTRAVQLSALGWRRVGERSAAAGRLTLDQEDTPFSAPTLRVEPYVSNPFVLTDTINPAMVRTRARLEGAMGWTYHGWRVGGGAGIESREQQGQLPSNLLVTISTRLSALDGDATRADLDGTVFRAHENRFSALVDVRWLPVEGRWRAGLLARTARDYSERTDFLAELRSEIEAWSPGASLELARRVTRASWVAVAFGQTWYSAASTIPAPNGLGDEYQRLIAPELALIANAARATAFTLTVSTEFGVSALWARLSREELLPTDREPIPTLAPEGDRSRWTLAIGLHL